MKLFDKIKKTGLYIRLVCYSAVFNFRHLPFSQACRMPILLFKPHLKNNSGKFIIDAPIKFGMIKLGMHIVSIFPNKGIMLENRGCIRFKGETTIGGDSAISIGKDGYLELGDKFNANTGLRIACYHHISFGENVLVGWNAQVIDTDFHALTNAETGRKSKGYGPVRIGHEVWIANNCKIYKNVSIPHSCVLGADTILHRAVDCPPHSLITSKIETTITTGFYRDRTDDKIHYRRSSEE